MINFRFHIVSLTAVLLALGIGLLLGTAFFDDATVNFLHGQLDTLSSDLDAADERNADLQGQLDSYEREDGELDEQIGERLLDDQLTGDPVLVIQPQGLDGSPEDRVLEGLGQAGAEVLGVWRFTDRFTLDDDDEVEDLATALDLATDDTDRLRQNVALQLSDVLYGAMSAPGSTPGPGILGAPEQPTQPSQPELLSRLHEGGFVDYELPEGAEGNVVPIPPDDLRVVVITGEGAVPSDGALLRPMLTSLASEGSVPAVVAMRAPLLDDGGSEAQDEPPPTPLVTTIRDDDVLSERISTVDDLERVAGRVATVLALEDATPGLPVVGHYGLGEGAQRLLPPVQGGS
jgi:hypothetical protein